MKKLILIISLLLLITTTSCISKKIKTFEKDEAKAFLELANEYNTKMDHNYVLIDLRELNTKYKEGHFFGFINYDIKNGSLENLQNKLKNHHYSKSIFLIDESGEDVEKVANFLKEIGYKKIYIYLGGYSQLVTVNDNYFTITTGTKDCDC